jgi:hypothetical protein
MSKADLHELANKAFEDLKASRHPESTHIHFADVVDDIEGAQNRLSKQDFAIYKAQMNDLISHSADVPPIIIIDVERGKLVVDFPTAGMAQAHYNRCGVIESYTVDGDQRHLNVPPCESTAQPQKQAP